jgi:hypothetical protein
LHCSALDDQPIGRNFVFDTLDASGFAVAAGAYTEVQVPTAARRATALLERRESGMASGTTGADSSWEDHDARANHPALASGEVTKAEQTASHATSGQRRGAPSDVQPSPSPTSAGSSGTSTTTTTTSNNTSNSHNECQRTSA